MLNEFSMETLYEVGLGMESHNKEKSLTSDFDGDFDSLALSIASSENYINFSDMYYMLEEKNTNDKIKMLNKLSIRYGRGGSQGAMSIEAYLQEQSMEAEEENIANDAKGNKFFNWMKTTLKKIVEFIARIFRWIGEKIKGLFTRNKNIDEIVEKTNGLDDEQERLMQEALRNTELAVSGKGVINLSTIPAKVFASYVEKYHVPLIRNLSELPSTILETTTTTSKKTEEHLDVPVKTIKALDSTLKFLVTVPGLNAGKFAKVPDINEALNNSNKDQKAALKKFNEALKRYESQLKVDGPESKIAAVKFFTKARYVLIPNGGAIKADDVFSTDNASRIAAILKENITAYKTLVKSFESAEKEFNKARVDVDRALNSLTNKVYTPVVNTLQIVFSVASKYQQFASDINNSLITTIEGGRVHLEKMLAHARTLSNKKEANKIKKDLKKTYNKKYEDDRDEDVYGDRAF